MKTITQKNDPAGDYFKLLRRIRPLLRIRRERLDERVLTLAGRRASAPSAGSRRDGLGWPGYGSPTGR